MYKQTPQPHLVDAPFWALHVDCMLQGYGTHAGHTAAHVHPDENFPSHKKLERHITSRFRQPDGQIGRLVFAADSHHAWW